jgi:hypothetical protein
VLVDARRTSHSSCKAQIRLWMSSEKKKRVAGQLCRKDATCSTRQLNKEIFGIDKYWVLLAV